MVDLEYEPGSLLPPFPRERIDEFEKWLAGYWERERIKLPAAYVRHITKFHGGVPGKKCFRDADGRVRVVGRFFNFLREEDLTEPYTKSWRSWSLGPDIRLDYRVEDFLDNEFWCARLGYPGCDLVPIAGLDYAGHDCRGMDEFDLLCLHYSQKAAPFVVTWPFDGSSYEEEPELVRVAESFADFLPMLYRDKKNRVATERIDRF